MNEDQEYLFTLRFLLERLSWFARDSSAVMTYTLAHIIRMKLSKLREYESKLRVDPGCRIHWPALDPKGGRIDQPKRIEMLQAADLAASATFAAFNPDKFGNVEPRYLEGLSPRLYRRGCSPVRVEEAGARVVRPRPAGRGRGDWCVLDGGCGLVGELQEAGLDGDHGVEDVGERAAGRRSIRAGPGTVRGRGGLRPARSRPRPRGPGRRWLRHADAHGGGPGGAAGGEVFAEVAPVVGDGEEVALGGVGGGGGHRALRGAVGLS
ncbi:hypothetical protein SCALM49S_04549 [Streptomyces californicus]